MRDFVYKYKPFSLLFLIFVVCEIIVNPIGEFPLNDDWSYSKSVNFALQGTYTIGDFGAMTLFTHLLWGTLFTKIFGFSFTVLRFSTLISSIIGLFFMNKLIIKITKSQWLAFFSCLLLLLNPLYFSLANTYMTDVNFTTLFILSCYFAFSFFETKREVYILYFFFSSSALVLIRQFGIILPICFFIACFILQEKRGRYLIFSAIVTGLIFTTLKLYEIFLKETLSPGSAYTFSGSIDLFSLTFWENFSSNLALRYKVILIHILLYGFPLATVFIVSIIKSVNKIYMIIVSLVSVCVVYFVLKDELFPFHNIFTNMSIGPETFYEGKGHTYSENFARICEVIKIVFCSTTVLVLFLALSVRVKSNKLAMKNAPEVLFLLCLLGSYIFMILITQRDVYFDRYHLPLIIVVIFFMSYILNAFKPDFRFIILPLICFFYVSVFGTKDYLKLNRTRWEAYYFIKKNANTTAGKINGGFEVNSWDDGKNNWWADYNNLNNYDYLIQFKKEDGFKLLRSYTFQRYFPFKKDTVNLFMREHKVNEADENSN
jgi:4-amino-4-deoxy-L-arabinose transferase-like glycosyltransferase